MIITRTPYRVSFFGGGSDYPAYYRQYGGAVLGTTINKYCYLMVRESPSFGKPYKLTYSKVEEQDCIAEIQHPAVRETLAYMGYPERVEIYHTSDLPARSGVGSSSAFVVGLVKTLDCYCQWHESRYGKDCYCPDCMDEIYTLMQASRVAEASILIEQDMLKETVGCQDQYLCALGGFRLLEFPQEGPVAIGADKATQGKLEVLQQRLLLYYTGIQRTASDVASGYVDDLAGKHLTVIQKLTEMAYMGAELVEEIASGGDPDKFGIMLDVAWRLKQGLRGVSTPKIDDIHDRARLAGALGSKVLGAGGGGHMLFYVPIEKQAAVRKALGDLVEVPFRFEEDGCSVIYRGEE